MHMWQLNVNTMWHNIHQLPQWEKYYYIPIVNLHKKGKRRRQRTIKGKCQLGLVGEVAAFGRQIVIDPG